MEESWLSLGEAARLLGVTTTTLRRWSDGGHLPRLTTPGGHRRFPREAIEELLPPTSDAHLQISGYGEQITAAYRQEKPADCGLWSWLGKLPPEEVEQFRRRGQRIVECLLAHLEADKPGPALANLRQANDYAGEYGGHSRKLGANLSEAVAAFLHFRQPFLRELATAMRQRNLGAKRSTEVLLEADLALNQLLINFLGGWERES